MRTHRTLRLLLTVLAFGCGSDHFAPPTQPTPLLPVGPFVISGHVSEYTTNGPAADLLVRIGTETATTDKQGNYSMRLDRGEYDVLIADIPLPVGNMKVNGAWTSGDFYINGLRCAARYGAVTDARNGRAVPYANVLGRVKTDAQGWYRYDFYGGACNGCGTCNTTLIEVEAAGYKRFSRVLGRGVNGVLRLDVQLEPI